MPDQMKIEILEDGTISVTTDKISGTNHVSADQFLNEVAKMAGGKRETVKRKERYSHTHSHADGHAHSH
jgi:hypothetical protein